MSTNHQDSLDIIKNICNSLSEIKEVNFVTFKPYELLQNRLDITGGLKIVVENALLIRSKYNFPFWDSFNSSLFNTNLVDEKIFQEIKFHNQVEKVHNIDKSLLETVLLKRKNADDYMTFSSQVKLEDDRIMHLPLLDFHIPVSYENENICVSVINSLNLRGFLLDSGKSYHFYGLKLFSENEMINFLANALFFAPIIDRAWVAHQLIERRCSLRISKKYSRLPISVRAI